MKKRQEGWERGEVSEQNTHRHTNGHTHTLTHIIRQTHAEKTSDVRSTGKEGQEREERGVIR